MSFTQTTNYAFQKPVVGTELDDWGDELNDNWDAVDNQLKINADAIAATSVVAANSVDNVKLANMPSNTIKGCITAGDPVDLTVAQVNTMLGVTIADGSVTNAKLANMPANTIKGVTITGVPIDLTAAQVNTILGTGGGVADNSVTNAKLADMAAATIKGSVAGGDPADLSAAQVSSILGLGGAAVILDDSVTNAKLANMAANTIKGSVAGGDPADLSAAQVLSITSAATTTQLADAIAKETQNAQSGSYTLAIGDVGKMVTFSGVATLSVNTGIFSAGHRVDILALGSGVVTIAGTATKRVFPSGANKLAGQYAGATIWFISATEYVLIGNVIV